MYSPILVLLTIIGMVSSIPDSNNLTWNYSANIRKTHISIQTLGMRGMFLDTEGRKLTRFTDCRVT